MRVLHRGLVEKGEGHPIEKQKLSHRGRGGCSVVAAREGRRSPADGLGRDDKTSDLPPTHTDNLFGNLPVSLKALLVLFPTEQEALLLLHHHQRSPSSFIILFSSTNNNDNN